MSGGDRILITGAGGIVGRACVSALRLAGKRPVAIARIGTADLLLDLSEPAARTSMLAHFDTPPTAIVHLAAAVPHDPRYPDDRSSADITRTIDRTVAAAQKHWGCPVVYMSTCGLYDPTDPLIKTPSRSAVRTRSPYFAAKADGEVLFAKSNATILRLAAPVGPGIKPAVVMSKFIAAAHAGNAIELWSNGAREQDFIHVDDVASLVLAAIEQPVCGTFNCARGTAVTMAELAHEIVQIVGGSIRFADTPDPAAGDTARYDVAATQSAFSWKAHRSLAAMITSVQCADPDLRDI